jgi:hypothetical protein
MRAAAGSSMPVKMRPTARWTGASAGASAAAQPDQVLGLAQQQRRLLGAQRHGRVQAFLRAFRIVGGQARLAREELHLGIAGLVGAQRVGELHCVGDAALAQQVEAFGEAATQRRRVGGNLVRGHGASSGLARHGGRAARRAVEAKAAL